VRDHIQSDRMAAVCQSLNYGFDQTEDTLLRAVLEKNKSKEAQAEACLALAQRLQQRAEIVKRLKDNADLAKSFADYYGKDAVAQKDEKAAKKVRAESEKLFDRAADKFGDVKLPYGGTVATKARSELFDLRFLAVGNKAPVVEGEDQDGKKFKLSDYKGKVV